MNPQKKRLIALLESYLFTWRGLPPVARAKLHTLLVMLGWEPKPAPEPSWPTMSRIGQFIEAAVAVATANNIRVGKSFVAMVGEAMSAAFYAAIVMQQHDVARDDDEDPFMDAESWKVVALAALNCAYRRVHGMSLLLAEPHYVDDGKPALLMQLLEGSKIIAGPLGVDTNVLPPPVLEHDQIRGQWRRWGMLATKGAWEKDTRLREDAWDFFALRFKDPEDPPKHGLGLTPGMHVRLTEARVKKLGL